LTTITTQQGLGNLRESRYVVAYSFVVEEHPCSYVAEEHRTCHVSGTSRQVDVHGPFKHGADHSCVCADNFRSYGGVKVVLGTSKGKEKTIMLDNNRAPAMQMTQLLSSIPQFSLPLLVPSTTFTPL